MTAVGVVAMDAFGTLIHPVEPLGVTYARIGHAFGSRRSLEEITADFRSVYRRCLTGIRTAVSTNIPDLPGEAPGATSPVIERAFWRDVVVHILPDTGSPEDCFETLWQAFANPGAWRVDETAADAVRLLEEAGFTLAIASNFDERLHAICDGHETLRRIPHRIISSEVGWRKPSPHFYHAAERRLGVRPEELWMIGDDRTHDVIAPLAAGWHAVWLSPARAGTALSSDGEVLFPEAGSLHDAAAWICEHYPRMMGDC